MANEIQESINKAISTIVDQRIDALELDKTIIGVIDSVVDSTRSIYKIKSDGGYFNARSTESNAIYLPGMAVYIQIPQNDMTKEKLIISRATSLQKDKNIDAVVSAINNYSILGNSVVISNIDETNGLSLRSYHDPRVEEVYPETIKHRAQFLYAADAETNNYDIDLDTFALYKENATALMIEADFRTSLDSTQRRQYGGVYGLGLNLVFENNDYQYGETQGEIFDCFSKDTKAKEIQDEEEIWHTLEEYDAVVQSLIFNPQADFNSFIKNDGLLDKSIYEIENLIEVYIENNKADYVQVQEENNDAYVLMLKELKLLNSYESVQDAYSAWRNLAIAPPAEKIVSLTLDSDHMTGSPFYFSSWSSQYAIFEIDLSTFKRIENIVFYKDGFQLDENMCEHGVDTGKEIGPKEDIFMKELKIYALQPISAVNGDYRLEIQSPNGLILNTFTPEETLNIAAKVTKAYYEDLSDTAAFYWFKKSKNVTTVSSDDYHQYGGVGWKWLRTKGAKKDFQTHGSENYAYENRYKCVAVIDSSIVLNQEFIIYNQAFNSQIIIESDLGTAFSFDAGEPILTCKIKEDDSDYQEYTEGYRYTWAIVVNGQRTFLTGEQIQSSLSNLASVVAAANIKNLTRGVKFFNGEIELTDVTEIWKASRIQFPVVNLLSESFVQFECYVDKIQGELFHEIGVADLIVKNSIDATLGTYTIAIENSEQIFQYDEYGNPPNAKKLKSPQEILPLVCHLYNPTGLEIPNSNYSVNWIVPIENTMIAPSSTLSDNPMNGLKDLDINLRFVFDIAQIYNEDYHNNQILCRVNFNGVIIEKETNFYFGKVGSNGTNGTDMVLRISPSRSHSLLNTQPLTLYRYDDYNKIWFNDGNTSPIVTSHIKADLFQKNDKVNIDNIAWNIAGNTQTYNNAKGKYLEISDNGQTLTWNEEYNPTGLSNYIIRAVTEYKQKTYYAFYGLPQIIYHTDILPRYTLIGINKKSLLKEVVYNADGRNPIYDHNQGVELVNVPADYLIEWHVQSGTHEPDFLLLEERNGKEGLNQIGVDKSLRQVYVLPNNEYAGANNDNLIIANIGTEEQLVATVVIPIHMSLNTFGLASLNAWDGNTVTIDNDNGYIMAPQIGAGEKDKHNRFTGIVMGKTETYTGKSANQKDIGLLGYAHGIQSIFLDAETGEATFGLPDGYRLDKSGDTPVPAEGDTYAEGRIELRPGAVSKIGGWRLGHQSLYYTADKNGVFDGSIGESYYELDREDDAAKHHVKDIPHDLQGILLSAVPAYISIKGRELSAGDISDSSDSQIAAGDSLELQLDPQNTTMFAIYRHHENKRQLLSGINTKGQLIANRIEQAPAESTSTRSSLGIESINAFDSDTGGYVGLNLEAGSATGLDTSAFFRIFISKDDVGKSDGAVHLTGGQFNTSSTTSSDKRNDYTRAINIHGNSVNLYAKDNNNSTTDHQDAQNVRLLLSKTQFYAGDVDTSHIYLPASGAANITTIGSNTIKGAGVDIKTSGNQDINLRTNNDNDAHSYLKLNADASTSILGATNLYGYARNGDVGLYARNNGTNSSWMTLVKGGAASLRGATGLNLTAANGDAVISSSASLNFAGSGTQLYLPAASTGQASYLNAGTAFSLTTPGILSLTAKAGSNTNAINVSTDIGGFAVQKQGSYKFAAITSNNLGTISRYGIFQDRIGASGGNANNSVWADGRYITNSFGAEGYAFSNQDSITDGSSGYNYTITGYNIESLLAHILRHLGAEVSGVNSAISTINGSISSLQSQINSLNNNKANSSDLQSLADDFDNHQHEFTYTTTTIGEQGATVVVYINKSGGSHDVYTSKPV